MTAEKTREDRLRRAAARQGLTLTKSRKRDRLALSYGKWWLVDQKGEVTLGGTRWEGVTLDDVEQYLNGGQQ